jgi:hypothetical protein
MKISVTQYQAFTKIAFIVFIACGLGLLFLDKVHEFVAILITTGLITGLILAVGVIGFFGVTVFLRKVEFVCPRCDSNCSLQVNVGFVCPKCGVIAGKAKSVDGNQ